MSADQVVARYNEEVRAPGSGLATLAEQVRSYPTLTPWPGAYLARPLFVAEREIRAFADDLRHLLDITFALPDRMFAGDLEAFRSLLGISDTHWEAIRQYGGDIRPARFGRADMYHDGTSFKLLETNLGSESGGWALGSEMSRAMLEVDDFAAFARRNRLGYVHPVRALAQALRDFAAPVAAGREPVVAMLEWRDGLKDYGELALNFQSALRSEGLDILVAEVPDVHEQDDALYLGDTRIDVVYRCFVPDQIAEETGGWDLAQPLLRAHRAGGTLLWTPFSSNMFANKACLALLSDPARRALLGEDERRLVDRVLPWTRLVNTEVLRSGTDLLDECRERRDQLILKVNARGGGVGIVVGWESDDATWRRALEDYATEGYVVQERVVPRTEIVVNPATGATEGWQAAYGLFYTPQGFAGSYAKVVPAGSGGVISIHGNARSCSAAVFQQGDLPADAPR
ncbi:glutathionylspermidine synthase family protein [Actinoplanes sp. N902-109]|uniref:glutathionylspermidine synthase family protein n=1 Tax=Actinoplanes sp. (strain N902-109) TaxID=649831 RepID=UPI0003295AC2|nr:glutathionylspermidine synthase family protein [Actinoplanes sp. N902-109]AGL12160.1 hypothetical protein K924_0002 [Actinoplanes sp. N902-109]AGL16492.1 orfE [Actinoplanes sp. N902-109]